MKCHSLLRSINALFQFVRKTCCIFALALIFLQSTVYAIVDSNNNGMSDLWEQQYNNGQLSEPPLDPAADPDHDGWTNAQEAASGTHPFDPKPPNGILCPSITRIPALQGALNADGTPATVTPETIRLSWQTITGKQYTLLHSTDLSPSSWLPVGEPWIGNGTLTEHDFTPATYAKSFWKVRIGDVDSDTDELTDAEEALLGTNPQNTDSDGDGLTDGQEAILGTNPNTANNPGIAQGSISNGDFSEPKIGTGLIRATTYDTWASVPYWKAIVGNKIEYQNFQALNNDRANQYCELKADPAGNHGIQQTIGTVEGKTYLILMDCKARSGNTPEHSDFVIRAGKGPAPASWSLNHNVTFTDYIWTKAAATFKAESSITTIALLPTNLTKPAFGCLVDNVTLLPVEVAPEVLAVNSDFDEGRIDPATGYAIPDCDDVAGVDPDTGSGNAEIALNAARDHLDGNFTNDEKITKDMHKGWFGVNPKLMDDAFWDGATVTIKKIDKIDDDTGYQESGQVRFYAKWGSDDYYGISPYDFTTLQPVNLVSAGVNKRPGEGVYGATSTIPDNAEFWMEGVRPGKITLEWRYQKGSTDLKHEQTFLVATQKSKQDWINEVYYQVKLQASDLGADIDLSLYDPANGFFLPASKNYKYIQTVYYYYMQLFQQYPEKFYWAGMAKTAGASVYAGMVDMATWKTSVFVDDEEVDKVLIDFMIQGNKDIFTDMAWAHRAYAASGIGALNYVEEQQGTTLTDFEAWRQVNDGFKNDDVEDLREGNRLILRREQSVVMPPLYDEMKTVWLDPGTRLEQFLATDLSGIVYPPKNAAGEINIDEMFSINSRNPVEWQLGPGLQQVVPNGRLSNFDHRWEWIDNAENGMLQIWLGTSTTVPGFSAAQRNNLNGSDLTEHAKIYSMLPTLGGLRDQQFPPPPW